MPPIQNNPIVVFNAGQIDLIKNTVAVGATDNELELFLHQCRRTQLDPLARQIYCVFRWADVQDPQTGVWKKVRRMSIQTAIDGFRLIAERTGQYAGQLGPEWCGKLGSWQDVWLHAEENPAAARVGALRKDFSAPLWSVADWKSYAQVTSKGALFSNWKRMGPVMIAKCAEALALRRAFPQELSGLTTPEELSPEDEDQAREPVARPDAMRPLPAPADLPPINIATEMAPPEPRHPEVTPAVQPKPGRRSITEIAALEREAREAADQGTAVFRAFWRRFRKDDKQVTEVIQGLASDLRERMDKGDKEIETHSYRDRPPEGPQPEVMP